MNTLNHPSLAPLLTRLLDEEKSLAPRLGEAIAELSSGEYRQQLRSERDYPELYRRLKDFPLAVSEQTGRLLYVLARACRAKRIVEFGSSFGFSTLHLAAALRDNGGGLLITTEFEPSKLARARENLAAAGLLDLVEIREGDARCTLSANLPAELDLVLMDGAKGLYPEILTKLEPVLRAGALILADDADESPDYLARVRSPEGRYQSCCVGEGIELSVWLG